MLVSKQQLTVLEIQIFQKIKVPCVLPMKIYIAKIFKNRQSKDLYEIKKKMFIARLDMMIKLTKLHTVPNVII